MIRVIERLSLALTVVALVTRYVVVVDSKVYTTPSNGYTISR